MSDAFPLDIWCHHCGSRRFRLVITNEDGHTRLICVNHELHLHDGLHL